MVVLGSFYLRNFIVCLEKFHCQLRIIHITASSSCHPPAKFKHPSIPITDKQEQCSHKRPACLFKHAWEYARTFSRTLLSETLLSSTSSLHCFRSSNPWARWNISGDKSIHRRYIFQRKDPTIWRPSKRFQRTWPARRVQTSLEQFTLLDSNIWVFSRNDGFEFLPKIYRPCESAEPDTDFLPLNWEWKKWAFHELFPSTCDRV